MRITLIVAMLLVCSNLQAQDTRTIKLKNQVAEFEPAHFHIVFVKDDREDTTYIGTMHVGLGGRKVKINLQGGASAAIATFMEKDVIQKKSTTPLTLHINELQVTEKRNGMMDVVDIVIKVAFYLSDQKLIEYTGSASQSGIDGTTLVDGLVRKNVTEVLTRFDDWWADHKKDYSSDVKLTPGIVKVNVVEGTNNGDQNLLVYSTKRPLTLNDFRGEPDDMSLGAAVTYSGISVSYKSLTQEGVAAITVSVAPIFTIDKSWCRTKSRNAYTLNHEQRHFDITALKACELMATIKNYPFTPDHYEKELEDLRQKTMKELEEEQNAYDKQTTHGTVKVQQMEWNDAISKRLAKQTCY